jgi:hypothetical protein
MEGIDPTAVKLINYAIKRADRALIALRGDNENIDVQLYADCNRNMGGVDRVGFIRQLDG